MDTHLPMYAGLTPRTAADDQLGAFTRPSVRDAHPLANLAFYICPSNLAPENQKGAKTMIRL